MYKVTVTWPDGSSEKLQPNTGGSAVKVWKQGETFNAVDFVMDSIDPLNMTKKWAVLENGHYVAVWYPSASRGFVRCTWPAVVDNPLPEPTVGWDDTITLIRHNGAKAEYKFNRIL